MSQADFVKLTQLEDRVKELEAKVAELLARPRIGRPPKEVSEVNGPN